MCGFFCAETGGGIGFFVATVVGFLVACVTAFF
jgi:hypothetical protein